MEKRWQIVQRADNAAGNSVEQVVAEFTATETVVRAIAEAYTGDDERRLCRVYAAREVAADHSERPRRARADAPRDAVVRA